MTTHAVTHAVTHMVTSPVTCHPRHDCLHEQRGPHQSIGTSPSLRNSPPPSTHPSTLSASAPPHPNITSAQRPCLSAALRLSPRSQTYASRARLTTGRRGRRVAQRSRRMGLLPWRHWSRAFSRRSLPGYPVLPRVDVCQHPTCRHHLLHLSLGQR